MNELKGVLDLQTRSMLDGISTNLETRKKAILEEAKSNARELLRRVRRENLNRIQTAVNDERRLLEQGLQKERASIATHDRQVRQRQERERLRRGRKQLREELLKRWSDKETRLAWAITLATEASAALEFNRWVVEHPAELDDDDIATVRAAMSEPAGSTVEMLAVSDLAAGLRVRCDGTSMDMTLEGLMAHEATIEGLLLAEIYRLENEYEAVEKTHD